MRTRSPSTEAPRGSFAPKAPQGETSCANRIARLARLAGIKAQIGYGAGLVPMAASHSTWMPLTPPG